MLLGVSAGVVLLATISAIPSALRAMRLDARGTVELIGSVCCDGMTARAVGSLGA
jgi:hypothetical protein